MRRSSRVDPGIPLLIATILGLLLSTLSGYAHDVKDPVCRMIVDSDATKFKQRLGNKTFYFCSKRCQESFAREPEKYERLAAQLEKEDPREYTVEFRTTRPPIARQPVEMEFAVRYTDTKELVREFEVIHERLFHLIMVTEDLSWFEHQHPVRGEDGIFRLTWRFPRPGSYRLYADFTPSDGDNQVKLIELTVGGGPSKSYPLRPDAKRVKQIGEYRVELQVRTEPLRMETPAVLTYTFRDRQGRLIRDLQSFIGAPGHLIAISQDGKEVIHTHNLHATEERGKGALPQVEATMGQGHLNVTPEMATETGPSISFKLTLPTAGLYKTWAQFMRNNRVITVPFTFQVADLWETAAKPKTPAAAARPGAVQQATIVIDGEYRPNRVTVRAGKRVRLTFVLKEEAGCGEVLQIPALGVKRALKPGQQTVVTFTPRKAGTIPFTCGMNMYSGRIVVN